MNQTSNHSAIFRNKSVIFLAAFVAVALLLILISYFVLHIPIVAVCTMVILEALLCSCLSKIPIWVHGLVAIGQIVAGVMAGKVIFMALMALVYVGSLVLLHLWGREEVRQ